MIPIQTDKVAAFRQEAGVHARVLLKQIQSRHLDPLHYPRTIEELLVSLQMQAYVAGVVDATDRHIVPPKLRVGDRLARFLDRWKLAS